MHELSFAQQLLDLALSAAEQAQAVKITRLNLTIGEFASMVDDSIQFYWDFIAKGTPAEGALLHFERVRGRFSCQTCHHSFGLAGFGGQCPMCGSTDIRIEAGEELCLDSIEVEKVDNADISNG